MIIIGEKINATRKSIRKAIDEKDKNTIVEQIRAQTEGGARYIDLNAGNDEGNIEREKEDLHWLIDIALEATDKALALDAASPAIVKDAAEYLNGRRPWMFNSLKNDTEMLKEYLPFAARHNVPVVALALSGESIPDTVAERLENCKAIAEQARKAGLPVSNLYFDPLVMPISSNYKYGKLMLDTLKAIKSGIPEAKTTIGLSNFSFGLPERAVLNRAFIIAAIVSGLDSAFCNPNSKNISRGIILGRLIDGQDRHCRKFSRAVRSGKFV